MATKAAYDHSLKATFTYKLPALVLGILSGLAVMKLASMII